MEVESSTILGIVDSNQFILYPVPFNDCIIFLLIMPFSLASCLTLTLTAQVLQTQVQHLLHYILMSKKHSLHFLFPFTKWSDCWSLSFLSLFSLFPSFFSHPTLFSSLDCSLPGFSVHRLLEARILKWVAKLTQVSKPMSYLSCIGRWVLLTFTPPWKSNLVFLLLLLLFSFSVVSNSLQTHGQQHVRLPVL